MTDAHTSTQREKPVYRWNVARAGYPGWLKHLWWIRDDHGRWIASSVCGRPKRKTLWPAFVPPERTELAAANDLIQIDGIYETCAVCRTRAEGIVARGQELAEGESSGKQAT